jgi:hypothetical protein
MITIWRASLYSHSLVICNSHGLIINKINKVQWVDFKLENVLVSLHSLKTMGLGCIIFKGWRVTWTFSYTYISDIKDLHHRWILNVYQHLLWNTWDKLLSDGWSKTIINSGRTKEYGIILLWFSQLVILEHNCFRAFK